MSVSAGGRFWLTDPVPGIDKEYYFSHHRATVAAHIATFLTGAKVSDTPAYKGVIGRKQLSPNGWAKKDWPITPWLWYIWVLDRKSANGV